MSETWKEFNKNELTHSAAHYLMAIDEVHQQQGYARLVDVAKHLDISKGSLSTSLKPLIKKNFISEDQNKHLSLTKKGQAFTDHINNSKETLTEFFTTILNLPEHAAEVDACKIEHLLSGQTISQIKKLNHSLKSNPPKLNEKLHCETYESLPN